MSRAFPQIDMTGWSIDQFELLYDGLAYMGQGANALICQPRALRSDNTHPPGAKAIATILEDGIDWWVVDLIDRLKVIRFDVALDDDRRVRLLLRYDLDNPGLTVPELVSLAQEQSAAA